MRLRVQPLHEARVTLHEARLMVEASTSSRNPWIISVITPMLRKGAKPRCTLRVNTMMMMVIRVDSDHHD